MSLESSRSSLPPPVLDDPIVIRALAHPIRLKLYDLVGRDGPLTSAEAARALGISQALASHHMHQLAKYGYVEPAPAPDHRARPWRVTHTSWDIARGEPWLSRSGVGQSLIYLTEQQFVEFSDALHALLVPLVARRRLGDTASRPPGARPVSLTITVVPLEPTASGG